VTGSRSSRGDEGASLEALEIIDLEPGADANPNRDAAQTSHRRRGPAVIAVLVIVALLGLSIASRLNHSSRRAASTADATHTNIDLNDGRTASAPLFPFRVGAQILTGGARGLRLVDTDTGLVSLPNITGLPRGPVTIVAHSGTTVAVRAAAHMYWFTAPNGIAHRLDADTAFASARFGYLWLAGQGIATEVPGDRDQVPRTRVTTTGPAIGATSAGLLVVTKSGVALQPSTGTGTARLLLRAPATVIGVHADRVAWVADDCGVLRCPVHVTEVASGATSSWVQLIGHPSPLAVAGSSAVFSPDGGSLAVVVPNDDLTRAQTLLIADLRTRATSAIRVDGRFEEPARPGSTDATGTTIGWTLDGAFLVLGASPETGADRIAVVNPANPLVVSSTVNLDTGTTGAAIGVSVGSLNRPTHGSAGPIETGGPTALNLAGLTLVGADQQQVDVLDPARRRLTTFTVAGPVPNPAGPNSIARVTGGWLAVRSGAHIVVDLLPDDGGPAREVAEGSQVLSSDGGRHAWIVDVVGSTVRSYDPATGRLGAPVAVSGQMVAVDVGLVVRVENGRATRLEIVGPAGRVQRVPLIASPAINLLAGAGTKIAYTDQNGLHAYDVSRHDDVVLSQAPIVAVALSPDGTQIAWIENGETEARVLATRLDSTAGAVLLGGPADRVLVADTGTVLYTSGVTLRRGRADEAGSSPVYGLGPDPSALLALG